MKQITQHYKTDDLRIEEVPSPLLKKGGALKTWMRDVAAELLYFITLATCKFYLGILGIEGFRINPDEIEKKRP